MSPPAPASARSNPTLLRDLQDHFRQCASARGPMHRLHCAAEALDAFLAPRFVTTLALMTVVVLVSLSFPA